MATINLVPGTQYAQLARRRQRALLSVAGAIIILVLVLWAGAGWWRGKAAGDLKETTSRLKTVETEIARLQTESERVTLFEQRQAAVNDLLNTHVLPNRLLQAVEQLLPPTNVLSGLTANVAEGTVKLVGTAPTVDEIALAITSLKNAVARPTLFSTATVSDVARHEEKANGQVVATNYVFTAALTFDPKRLSTQP